MKPRVSHMLAQCLPLTYILSPLLVFLKYTTLSSAVCPSVLFCQLINSLSHSELMVYGSFWSQSSLPKGMEATAVPVPLPGKNTQWPPALGKHGSDSHHWENTRAQRRPVEPAHCDSGTRSGLLGRDGMGDSSPSLRKRHTEI